jgi:hypothetical protein
VTRLAEHLPLGATYRLRLNSTAGYTALHLIWVSAPERQQAPKSSDRERY